MGRRRVVHFVFGHPDGYDWGGFYFVTVPALLLLAVLLLYLIY